MSRFKDEQFAFELNQPVTGSRIDEIFRKIYIDAVTFSKCRQKYGCLDPSSLRKLKQLE